MTGSRREPGAEGAALEKSSTQAKVALRPERRITQTRAALKPERRTTQTRAALRPERRITQTIVGLSLTFFNSVKSG